MNAFVPLLAVLLAGPAAAPDRSLAAERTPAEQAIAQAERAIASSPRKAEAWSELALAYARRARETADHQYYARADEAIAKSLEAAPGNLAAKKARAWVLLGQHEFEAALALARELNAQVPDDLMVYGYLVDANVELGRYAEAEEAAQWMLDLRPGNVPGLTRAAYLRELFGDVDGALELFAQAFQQISESEAEDRAWILTQMAHLHAGAGRRDVALTLLDEALALFPDYHYALAQLGRLRADQGRFDEAVAALRKRHSAAPHPENLYDLAVALSRAGRAAEAREAFATFESEARGEMEGPDNANRELVFYYADHADRPEEALRLAERELKRRRDVYTAGAHAWALYRSGCVQEARAAVLAALEVGLQDAALLYRAGVILGAAGDSGAAQRRLQESLRVDPESTHAAEARALLGNLKG